jgi:hypothetical protein
VADEQVGQQAVELFASQDLVAQDDAEDAGRQQRDLGRDVHDSGT